MKDWIKNNKNTAVTICAAIGAVVGLTTAVLLCGIDATSSIAEVVNGAAEVSN